MQRFASKASHSVHNYRKFAEAHRASSRSCQRPVVAPLCRIVVPVRSGRLVAVFNSLATMADAEAALLLKEDIGGEIRGGDLTKEKQKEVGMVGDEESAPAEGVAGGVVALGKFEGLHLGHRALAERASELGKPVMLSLSGMAEVLGWEPQLPVVASDDRPRVLASWTQNCRGLVPQEHVLEFAKIRKLSPEQFVEKLAKELKVKGAVAGVDYRFGFRAAGKAADLVQLCEKYGLQSIIVEPVMDSKDAPSVDGCAKDKGQVSTTRVRKALAEGDVKRAAELLGRNHRLYIEVKDSVQTENVISFPIANVLNQPPTVGSYECSLYLEGSNDSNRSVVPVRISGTEIFLDLQDLSLVNKISQQSRIALDFLA